MTKVRESFSFFFFASCISPGDPLPHLESAPVSIQVQKQEDCDMHIAHADRFSFLQSPATTIIDDAGLFLFYFLL